MPHHSLKHAQGVKKILRLFYAVVPSVQRVQVQTKISLLEIYLGGKKKSLIIGRLTTTINDGMGSIKTTSAWTSEEFLFPWMYKNFD